MSSGETAQGTDGFGGWLAPGFSDPDGLAELNRRFTADPARMVVVDDALEPTRYRSLSRAMREDCDWEMRQGLIPRGAAPTTPTGSPVRWVDPAGYAGAPTEERHFQHGAFARALPGRAMSPGMIALVRLKALVAGPAFLDMIGAITGDRPGRLQEFLIRRMVRGDLAKPHDDAIGGRTFCLLLYLSDGWRPEFDGRFVMHQPDGDRPVDPLPNRMVLFDVNAGFEHSVRPFGETAGDWQRYNFTIWFA